MRTRRRLSQPGTAARRLASNVGAVSSVSSAPSRVEEPNAAPSSTLTTEPQPPPTSVAPSIDGSLVVADPPTAIATGAKRLWIASPTAIVALDPGTDAITAHVPAAGTIAMTLDTNIATSSADPPRLAACSLHQTVEIGTVSGAISATYPWGCTGIAAGAGALWIARDVQLVELGPQGDLVSTVDHDDGLGVAATNDAIWVIEGGSGHPQLREMQPGFHTTIATFPLDARPDGVIADDAGVWVSERSDDGTETLLGFATSSKPQLRRYPPGSGRVVAADGHVFVTGRETNALQRVQPGPFGDTMRWGDTPTPTRVEVTAGCPISIASAASVFAAAPFANPDPTGLADTIVPGHPYGALICQYGDVEATVSALGSTTYVGGALREQATVDTNDAERLASAANATLASDYTSTGTPDRNGPQFTVVALAIPGRSDIDIWYEDYAGSALLSNGRRSINPLINGFGADFSQLLDADLTRGHGHSDATTS